MSKHMSTLEMRGSLWVYRFKPFEHVGLSQGNDMLGLTVPGIPGFYLSGSVHVQRGATIGNHMLNTLHVKAAFYKEQQHYTC